mgnify:CR=1 FL=1
MGVVAVLETARGTGVSGKFGESFTWSRRWMIRVDSPLTSRVEIAAAPGVTFGDGHPNAPAHVAMEFDCQEASGDGLLWDLTVRYYVPAPEHRPGQNGLPMPFWSASGSTSTIAVYMDKDGQELTNSAGDPLEGAEREASSGVLAYTGFYGTVAAWSSLAAAASNTVNAGTWNGSAARTWKCEFKGAQKKAMTLSFGSSSQYYWEATWEFHYRAETWDWRPWDVGFNQLADSSGTPTAAGTKRVSILGADQKPVKAPVALSNGVAKAAGQKPDALQFRLYPETNFNVFGTPS